MQELVFRSVSKHGRQTARKVLADSMENALNKALMKYGHIRYFKTNFKHLNNKKMDLLTAIETAKAESKKARKSVYIIVEEDGECTLSNAPLSGASHKFVNGVEDKAFKDRKETVKKETVKADSPKEQPAAKTSNKKEMENKTKKTAAKKVAAKKSTANKPAKAADKKAPVKIEGEKKTLKIKQVLELMLKGVNIYRQSTGGKLSIVHMKAAKNKEHELAVIVKK